VHATDSSAQISLISVLFIRIIDILFHGAHYVCESIDFHVAA